MIGSPQSLWSTLFAKVLNGVRNFFVSRGGIVFVVLLFIFLLIWIAGPLIGLKSVSARVWVLLALTLIVLAVLLAKWVIDRRRGKQLQRDIEELPKTSSDMDRFEAFPKGWDFSLQ